VIIERRWIPSILYWIPNIPLHNPTAGAEHPEGDPRVVVQGERAGSEKDTGRTRMAGSLWSAAGRALPGAKVAVMKAKALLALI